MYRYDLGGYGWSTTHKHTLEIGILTPFGWQLPADRAGLRENWNEPAAR